MGMFKFAYSYIKAVSQKITGGLFVTAVATTIVLVAFVYFAFRDTTLYRLDAISLWQEAQSPAIKFSIYMSDKDEWTATNPLNKEKITVGELALDGENLNPDIASTKTKALAVWENKKGNEKEIAYSFWRVENFKDKNTGWSKPELFVIPGEDSNPTAQMRSEKDAIVVWVHNRWQIFYSLWDGEKWSKPEIIKVPYYRRTVTSLQLSEMFDKSSPYTLTFFIDNSPAIAVFDGKNWTVEKVSGYGSFLQYKGAKTDSSIVKTKKEMHSVYSWGGKPVRYLKMALNTKQDTKKDYTGYKFARLSAKDSLLYLLAQNTEGQLDDVLLQKAIATSSQYFDVTALYSADDKQAISVWASKDGGVYYSVFSVDTQKWSKPALVDENYKTAVSEIKIAPLEVVVKKKEKIVKEEVKPFISEEYCGDGKLNPALGEECENGVACKGKNQICDWEIWNGASKQMRKKMFPPSCECISFDEDGIDKGGDDGTQKGTDGDPIIPEDGKKDDQNKNSLEGWLKIGRNAERDLWYGPACGFDSFQILEKSDEDMRVKLLPASQTGSEYQFSKTGANSWSVVSNTGTIAIFPGADQGQQPQAVVLLKFSGDSVTFTGVDPTNGFQYCTGVFSKNAPPASYKGNLVPAPAQ